MIVLLISFCLCLFLLVISLPLSIKIGLVDKPGELKIHSKPIPITGGIAILFSMMIAVVLGGIWSHYHLSAGLLYFFLGGLSLCIIGLLDDVWHINPYWRFLFEVLVAVLIVKAGYSVKITKNVLVNYMFSAFFLVGAINAINMLDGMDGLAGGITLLSVVGFSYIFYKTGLRMPLLISLALAGSLTAFIFFNFYPAKIFLGDNGSYMLGFMIYLFAALLSSKPLGIVKLIGIILIICLPVLDAAFAIVRRLLRRGSLFLGDRSHSYDIFFRWTGSQVRTVLICYAIQLTFVIGGILLVV